MLTIEDLLAPTVLEAAYAWLCKRRKGFPAAADVWSFRRAWPQEQARLHQELVTGCYRFSLLSRVTLKSGEEIDVWSARDALVLKALSLVLVPQLALSRQCFHLKGRGGSKGAVRQVVAHLAAHRFVLRTDVELYYASIDHHLLLDRLAPCVQDRRLLNLVGQYLTRSSEQGGQFWHYQRGICLGCPLSPVIGAFFLRELDLDLARQGLFFVRFMDDILVLAPTRWKLRRVVRRVQQTLAGLKLTMHPAKTFIGRIDKGFDFLGYHFGPGGLSLARPSVEHFVARANRLYEHGPGGAAVRQARLGQYAQRWARWARAGLGGNPTLWDQPNAMRIAVGGVSFRPGMDGQWG